MPFSSSDSITLAASVYWSTIYALSDLCDLEVPGIAKIMHLHPGFDGLDLYPAVNVNLCFFANKIGYWKHYLGMSQSS